MKLSALTIRARILAESAKRLNWRGAALGLMALTDRRRAANPLDIARALPAGATLVLRDYDMPDRAALAKQLKTICTARRVDLLIGADGRLARNVGARGVHLPEWMLHKAPKIRQLFPGCRITGAVHGKAALIMAYRAGVDAVFLSPVFQTNSHPQAKTLGPVQFAMLAQSAPLPVLALGGVNANTLARLANSGAAGIGVIGAL